MKIEWPSENTHPVGFNHGAMIAAQLGKCSINVDVVSEPNDEGGGSVGKAHPGWGLSGYPWNPDFWAGKRIEFIVLLLMVT